MMVDTRAAETPQASEFDPRLEQVRTRLASAHPRCPHHLVDTAVAAACDRTGAYRIQTYRLLFIERHARGALEGVDT